MNIKTFLDSFYETLTFKKGEEFKEKAFRIKFSNNARIVENDEGKMNAMGLDEYIKEYKKRIKDYPLVYGNGIQERQIDFELKMDHELYVVRSEFFREYAITKVSGYYYFVIKEENGNYEIIEAIFPKI